MEPYQLGKLVQWAGTLETRKRMQKVVYLLQAAGCPYDADFILHHYGPYCGEMAQLTDSLVRHGLLEETPVENMIGQQYSYALPSESEASLKEFEKTAAGRDALKKIEPYEKLAKELLKTNLSELEHASTIAYFRLQGEDWPTALKKGCGFKRLDPNGQAAKAALSLAQRVKPGD